MTGRLRSSVQVVLRQEADRIVAEARAMQPRPRPPMPARPFLERGDRPRPFLRPAMESALSSLPPIPAPALYLPWHDEPWRSTVGEAPHCVGCGWPATRQVEHLGLSCSMFDDQRVEVCEWCAELTAVLLEDHERRWR